MKAGPKGAIDETPLPWNPRLKGADQFAAFCKKFIVTPKGRGAKKPMVLRQWQRDLVATVLDDRPKYALWVVPRGSGKSTLVAALGLHHLTMSGVEGARVVVVAQDERSSRRLLDTAKRMVELCPELEARCRIYADRIEYGATHSVMVALPGDAHRIEGEDASLAITDEIGFVRRDAYESLLHSTGKREESQMLMIGTPSPPTWREASPMLDLVLDGRNRADDPDFNLVEFSGDITHPVDCQCCWEAANPGLDDLVSRDHLRAALPPRTRESEFRRARLAEWVEQDDASLLPQGVWDALSTGEAVPAGERVVIALDGSFSDDTTAIVVGTVSETPHFDLVKAWAKPKDDDSWRVPVLEVEQAIRDAHKKWRVLETVADPFRYARTLQVLESEGMKILEFPHSPSRLTAATGDLYNAVTAGKVTHSGDETLAAHVKAAVIREDNRGFRLDKQSRSRNAPKIDAAAALLMAHSRATWLGRKKKRKARSFT